MKSEIVYRGQDFQALAVRVSSLEQENAAMRMVLHNDGYRPFMGTIDDTITCPYCMSMFTSVINGNTQFVVSVELWVRKYIFFGPRRWLLYSAPNHIRRRCPRCAIYWKELTAEATKLMEKSYG